MSKRHAAIFKSAYAAGALTPEQVLEFHRARFGNLRMEGGDDSSPDGTVPTDPPAPNSSHDKTGSSSPNGFPEDTPVSEMTDDQKAAYDRHMRQKNKERRAAFNKAVGGRTLEQIEADLQELEALRAANLTDAEKAIEEAKKQAAAETRAAVLLEVLPQRVNDKLETALAGRGVKADKIAELLEFADHTRFLTDDGGIDTDKVNQFADTIVPANSNWPDSGQGNRGRGTNPAKGVAAGAEMFAASRGKKTA